MASIEVGPLANHLDDEDLAAIEEAFEDADIELVVEDDAETRLVDGDIDEVFFEEFYDRLDANNLACDIYVPGDFEEVIEVGEYRVGSAPALISLLEELRDDMFDESDEGEMVDDEEGLMESYDDEGEEDVGVTLSDDLGSSDMNSDSLRYIWKTLLNAARSCVTEGTVLYLRR